LSWVCTCPPANEDIVLEVANSKNGRIMRLMNDVEIVDVRGLQRVMQVVMASLGDQGRNQANAGHAVGISQSTYSRLLRGKQRRLDSKSFRSILDALRNNSLQLPAKRAASLQRAFESTVLTEAGSVAVRHYGRWLGDEMERLTPKVHGIFTELFSHRNYRSYFSAFLKDVSGSRELPSPRSKRIWIALYRALEPLSDASATSGVERGWRELHSAEELRPFLISALERERLMLKRERDIVRISKLTLPYDLEEELYLPSDENPPILDAQDVASMFQAAENEDAAGRSGASDGPA
jgi:hypothetical protein